MQAAATRTDSRARRADSPARRAEARPESAPAAEVRTLRRCACGGGCPTCRAAALRPRLVINTPGDTFEREADAAAEAVMSARSVTTSTASPALRRCACGGSCPSCQREQEEELHREEAGGGGAGLAPPLVHDVLAAPGRPLPTPARAFMERRFGADFSGVRVHDDARAAESARAVDAHAYTVGRDVVFAAGRYAPGTAGGDRLLAHELAHVVQEAPGTLARKEAGAPLSVAGGMGVPRRQAVTRTPDVAGTSRNPGPGSRVLRRQPAGPAPPPAPAPAADPLVAPLSEVEWRAVNAVVASGYIGGTPLSTDPNENAERLAVYLLCDRLPQGHPRKMAACVFPETVRSDERAQTLKRLVAARGDIINWVTMPREGRMLYVMRKLVEVHQFPEIAAAGLVGNFLAESRLQPMMVQGGNETDPMVAPDSSDRYRRFTPDEVRDRTGSSGPRAAGVGLAQWTTPDRRRGLFEHEFRGVRLGSAILFNMEAQIDYVATEITRQKNFAPLQKALWKATTAQEASNLVLRGYEAPADIESQVAPRGNAAARALALYQAYVAGRRGASP